MQRHLKLAGALAIGVGAAGCSDFLTGPGLTETPNNPTEVSSIQLLVAVQARQFVTQEGQLARQAAIYTQQMTGIFNQQLEWGTKYLVTENDISGHYAGIYAGGGLVDMRRIQADEAASAKLKAIAKVWEGFTIGTATSLWGDLPYRQAVDLTNRTPALDPQQQIYGDIQALLSQAITELGSTGNTSFPQDLVYAGNSDRWRRAAYTLKARYHLHTGPRLGAAAYTAALAAAQQGINEAPTTVDQAIHGQAPGDFRSFHGNTLDDANIWSQFLAARADIAASRRFIDVMIARADPRLDAYFNSAAAVATSATCPGFTAGFRGTNQWGTPTPHACASVSIIDPVNRTPRPFRQPFVTWTENQLIMAEANFQLGNLTDALNNVNAVRAALGMSALAGPITLEQIMVEKWLAQFQNIDVYSDVRRTCFPRLVPGGPTVNVSAAEIPGRLPYGSNERLQNPNIPTPSAAPAKNWTYATVTCPSTGGTI
jgi:starch-binding outer membrane protein, SusD/RagB family